MGNSTTGMILVRGGLVVTVDPERRMIADGTIAIRDGQIIAVGKDGDVAPRYPAAKALDVGGSVVTPGFVDAHIHVTEHLWRGWVSDDAGVDEWLPKWLLPVSNLIPPEGEHVAALLAQIEMVRSGTTTFADAGTIFDASAVAEAVQRVGMRAILARWSVDRAPWPGRTARPPSTPRPTASPARPSRRPASASPRSGRWCNRSISPALDDEPPRSSVQ